MSCAIQMKGGGVIFFPPHVRAADGLISNIMYARPLFANKFCLACLHYEFE